MYTNLHFKKRMGNEILAKCSSVNYSLIFMTKTALVKLKHRCQTQQVKKKTSRKNDSPRLIWKFHVPS